MKEILVVIPYLAEAAQGHELELAVAGWEMHFKYPHKIVIVGDYPQCPPGWQRTSLYEDNVCFIRCPRVEPIEGQYRPHLDHVNKFLAVKEAFPEMDFFIYTCDDIYAVRDFTRADITWPKVSSIETPPIDWRRESGWQKDLGKTREAAAKKGWPTHNWVCHLPVCYRWPIVEGLIRRFDMTHNSYVMENLYFNMLRSTGAIGEPTLIPPYGPWKHEVRFSSPEFTDVEETGSIWIMNHNTGWSEELEAALRRHYGLS